MGAELRPARGDEGGLQPLPGGAGVPATVEQASEIAPGLLYYLRTFHAVASRRSFTRAGLDLGLSQPAVSAHMRALERAYRTRLFVVRHRQIRLTPEAEVLHTYASRIIHLLREAQREIAAMQGLERGQLTVGASFTLGIYLVPTALREFTRHYPGIGLELSIGTTADIMARLLAYRVVVGLVEAPVSHPEIEVKPLAEDEVVLVVRRGHPWARAGRLAAPALDGTPVLRREPASGTRALVDAALQQAGIAVATAMTLGSAEALRQAVLAGAGIAWLPRIVAARELASGDLVAVAVDGLDIRRTLWILRLRQFPASPAAEALLAELRVVVARGSP